MAKYADYVKDDIQDEIVEAGDNQQTRQEKTQEGFDMPDRFKGKSPEEIAKSYVELEKLHSRQAQDLGAMRKNVDDLIALQSHPSVEPPGEEDTSDPVSLDDLYDNPEEAISRVVEKKVKGRVEKFEQQLQEAQVKDRLNDFSSKHPEWQQTAASPEFQNWVEETPYRKRLAEAANSYDFDAANDLFDMYKSTIDAQAKVEEKLKREQKLQDATLETGTPQVPDTEQSYSRQDLMDARIAAKHGNEKARRWLSEHAESIAIAYERGHITD